MESRIPKPKLLSSCSKLVGNRDREELHELEADLLRDGWEGLSEEFVATTTTRKDGKTTAKPKPPQKKTETARAQDKQQTTAETKITDFLDISFPPLRSVLWDRSPISDESFVLGAEAHVPELVFRRACLASAFHAAARATGHLKRLSESERSKLIEKLSRPCFSEEKGGRERETESLVGCVMYEGDPSAVGDWVGGGWRACVDRIGKARPGEVEIELNWVVGSSQVMEKARETAASGGYEKPFEERSSLVVGGEELGFTEDEYKAILRDVVNKFRVNGPAEPMQYLSGYAKCLALPGDRLVFRTELILPALTLEFTPVTPLSILQTPLARQLDMWANKAAGESNVDPSDPTACGFLTLNHTRKAVFLLEDDPMAYELPTVGVWLRGSALPPSPHKERSKSQNGFVQSQHTLNSSWQSMLNDPFLWSVCLRYIHNERLREKVSPPDAPTTFLVAIYPPDSALAQFVECKYVMYQQKEMLQQVGVKPRPFLQLECGFEVDISRNATPMFAQGDGHLPNAVTARFFHVENLDRRRTFQRALESIVSTDTGEGHDINTRQQTRQDLNHHGIDSMYFRPTPDSIVDDGESTLVDPDQETEEGQTAEERQEKIPVQTTLSYADKCAQQQREAKNKLSEIYGVRPHPAARVERKLPQQSPKAYEARDESSEESVQPSESQAEKEVRDTGEKQAVVYKADRVVEEREDEESTRDQFSSTQWTRSSSRVKSGRRRKSDKDYFMNLVTAQQQQINLLQQQIMGLQRLMEEQIKSNSRPTILAPPPSPIETTSAQRNTIVSSSKTKKEQARSHIAEQNTAVYLANLEPSWDEGEDDSQSSSGAAANNHTKKNVENIGTVGSFSVSSPNNKVEKEDEESVNDIQEESEEPIEQHAPPPLLLHPPPLSSVESFSQISSPPASKTREGSSMEMVPASMVSLNNMNEMATEFGIPKIAMTGGKSDNKYQTSLEDEDSEYAEEDDDEWLAAVEAKYLNQIRRSTGI